MIDEGGCIERQGARGCLSSRQDKYVESSSRDANPAARAVREDTEGVSIFKKTSSRAFYFLINAFSAVRIPEGVADFCLISRRVATELNRMRERHRFLRGMISWSGFSRALVAG